MRSAAAPGTPPEIDRRAESAPSTLRLLPGEVRRRLRASKRVGIRAFALVRTSTNETWAPRDCGPATSSVLTHSRLPTIAFDARTHAHRRLPPIALNAAARVPTPTDGLSPAQREELCAIAVIMLFDMVYWWVTPAVHSSARLKPLGSSVRTFSQLGCPSHAVARPSRPSDSIPAYLVRALPFARTIRVIDTVVLLRLRLVNALKPRIVGLGPVVYKCADLWRT